MPQGIQSALCWKLISQKHDLCLSSVARKCISSCAFDTIMANGAQCPVPTQAGLCLPLSCFRVIPASTTEFCEPSSGCSTGLELEAAVAQIRGKDERGAVVRQKSRGEFPAQSADVLGTFAAPCHYWGITGPSVQLLSLPSPTNANQNPTQAAKIFRGFYKTNFNNPFKCFFRIEHEFAKSRVAYSS